MSFSRAMMERMTWRSAVLCTTESTYSFRSLPLSTRHSSFYQSYPLKSSLNANDRIRLGYFEDLTQFCALGFSRNNPKHGALFDTGEKSLLLWPEHILERLSKKMIKGMTSLREKQCVMVDYLIELCYDLALSTRDNVSQSFGFETFIGVNQK